MPSSPEVFRLCLDLNVWCAALLSRNRSPRPTACQLLTDIARAGSAGRTPVQLIISWSRLDRLRRVLTSGLAIDSILADTVIDAIANAASLGPEGQFPHLVLGGGAMPLRDPEDAGVLETALAGRAQVLVTANFADFVAADMTILVKGQVGIHVAADRELAVVTPGRAAAWLRQGALPSAAFLRSTFGRRQATRGRRQPG